MDENNLVAFCPHCLSLAIRVMDRDSTNLDYCDRCGNADINIVDFDTWEKMYEDRYGQKYLPLNKNKNGREQTDKCKSSEYRAY